MTSYRTEFLDFLQTTITAFYIAVPLESAGVEYLYQIIKLHSLQEILRADLILGGDTAHLANHSLVTALQAMQVRWGWGPGFACMEHGTPDTRIMNYSS